jgi:lipopolysaccharide export system protein LptC
MRISLRNTIAGLLLSAAAAASWYWSRPVAVVDQTEQTSSVPQGYYLAGAVLLGTDETGKVIYEVAATRAEERPDQSELLLSSVRVQYRPATEVHWLLTASNGEAPTDGSYLILQGEVELASSPTDGSESTIIRTSRLLLEPQMYAAISEEPVSVFFGGERLDAVGMKAYLKDDRLELESNIHGQFLP